MIKTRRGRFIVFEGIDGSGTSTQARLLCDRLNSERSRAVLTTEPSDGPVGTMIRQAMKGRVAFSASTEAFDAQMAYLFAADRFDHLYNEVDGVEKFLGEGVDVVSTRYYFSSFAYHCGDAKSFDLVRRLNSDFPAPDLVVYLNNPVSLSIERMAARKHKDQYENEAKLKHVSNNYAEIFSKYNGKLLALDAREPAETLHEQIYDYVKVL